MKKTLVRLLSLICCMALLAGCVSAGVPAATTPPASAGASESASAPAEPATPAPVETVTISWYWNEGNIQLPDDSYINKKILEDLNIKYIHIAPRGTDYEERLQLLLASQNVPEVITSYGTLTTNLLKWGVIQPVESYLNDQYIPNVIRISKNWDLAVSYLTRDDGHAWAIPNCNNSVVGETPYIRYDWLKKLNLEVPTTYEELADVLVAFTNNDPDGNGKKDTVGTMSNEYWGLGAIALNFAASEGGWYKGADGLATMGMFTEPHKEYLKYLKRLIDTGALDKELATTNYDNVMEQLKAGKVGFLFTWNDYTHNEDIRKLQPEADWRPMTPPKGVYDKGYMPCGGVMREEYCISAKTANVEPILKLMNYMADDKSTFDAYDYTGTYWPMKLGEPDVNWKINEDGTIESGQKDTAIAERNKSADWVGRTRRFVSQFDFSWTLTMPAETLAAFKTVQAYPVYLDIPDSEPLKPISTEPVVLPDNVAAFEQEWHFVKWPEFFYKAILGKVDIDTGWQAFMAEAEAAGLADIKASATEAFKKAGVLK